MAPSGWDWLPALVEARKGGPAAFASTRIPGGIEEPALGTHQVSPADGITALVELGIVRRRPAGALFAVAVHSLACPRLVQSRLSRWAPAGTRRG